MNATLRVVLGKTTKRDVVLQLPAVLGRSREADITVAHPLISRRHCEISESDGLLMLRDLSSLNGTMVGGRRIESCALLPDEEFTIGPLTFRVLYEYRGDLEAVPAPRIIENAETINTIVSDPTLAGGPELQLDEALTVGPVDESEAGELAPSNLMDRAGSGFGAAIPPAPAPAGHGQPAFVAGSLWPPPVAVDMLPTIPIGDAPNEPMEVDSCLQSGGHGKTSPWAIEPPPMASLGENELREPNPAEDDANARVQEHQPEVNPSATRQTRPSYGDELDPEFGSFLEGLQ